jgi:decaprenylphospho-beta-D-erythro-pentofuranosid-2-ulose 2-reductase
MLTKKKTYDHVVLVGSTSDIGLAILKQLRYSENAQILLIGRDGPEDFNIEGARVTKSFLKCDLEKFEDLQNFSLHLSSLPDIDLAIMAAGFLPPENTELNLDLVNKTMQVNTVGVVNALVVLAERMQRQFHGHILHISSVATMLPRSRNFTYGASKSSADFFARGLASKYRRTGLKISVLRPGFVHTKMSKNFRPAPFSISKEAVSLITSVSLLKNEDVFYAPRKLRIIMNFVSLLPKRLRELISK